MSLTKAAFFEITKPRAEAVEVEGFGDVFIRSRPQLEFSLRLTSYRDPVTQQVIPEEAAKADVHRIIDQVMVDENTPMFGEDDVDQLQAVDSAKLAPLLEALENFDGQKKQNNGSTHTSEN